MTIPEIDKKVGERIKEKRKAAGLTQMDVAGEMAPSFVHHIETGARRPSWTALARIAEAIGVDPHWLATGEPDPHLERIAELEELLAAAIQELEDTIAGKLPPEVQAILDAQPAT